MVGECLGPGSTKEAFRSIRKLAAVRPETCIERGHATNTGDSLTHVDDYYTPDQRVKGETKKRRKGGKQILARLSAA